MNNFFVIILDGVGIGELPDAYLYKDEGSNTLSNMAEVVGGLYLPNLQNCGLGNIQKIKGITPVQNPIASFGKMSEMSKGKDSTTGHWEISGLLIDFDFPYYPSGFPKELINKFLAETKLSGVLGNKAASGTDIINELGDEHVKTGFPIVYTSADSVFQIAAHESVIPLDRLYEICKIAREKILINENSVGRVIARPFIGNDGNYSRTTNRKDFSLSPPTPTILDFLKANDINTVAIGKINDLFNYQGISHNIKTHSNEEGINEIIKASKEFSGSFIFTNLVDFDVYYGHRNDPAGFAKALGYFDNRLSEIMNTLDETDALIITADHGNDPTTPSTDHSREYVPLLFYQKNIPGKNLEVRKTFSDVAQTIAEFFKVTNNLKGVSFLD
ncbi:MAG: phosphopentomutase [Ignavibacteriales bacterium CG_4_9_14_3_um_filter_34_10]|nr:MAG: phosphopentomutase [Ignavibacteriales bacterium CG_4_9_14_3_um_filter_34_10]